MTWHTHILNRLPPLSLEPRPVVDGVIRRAESRALISGKSAGDIALASGSEMVMSGFSVVHRVSTFDSDMLICGFSTDHRPLSVVIVCFSVKQRDFAADSELVMSAF